jgi:hypothetical protein
MTELNFVTCKEEGLIFSSSAGGLFCPAIPVRVRHIYANLMYIGPCIVVIVNDTKNQLDST